MSKRHQHIATAVTGLHGDLVRFLQYWMEQHAKNPADYPLSLPSGEWLEQFEAFCNLDQP